MGVDLRGQIGHGVGILFAGEFVCIYTGLQHTSASLMLCENADPSVRRDLETFMARLAPDGAPWYAHDLEGPDDMPAHVRAALTAVQLSIPIVAGGLALGTWQGIYLCEHRNHGGRRKVVLTLWGEAR